MTNDKATRSILSGISNNHFVPIDKARTREYVVTHEMGHALQNCLNVKISRQKGINYNKAMKTIPMEMTKEVMKMTEAKEDFFLSSYAKTNAEEWFAETFTSLKLSSNPKPVAKALGEYLRRFNK